MPLAVQDKDKPKEKEIKNMSYMELMQKAREMGMKNVAGLTKRELLFELGGSPEGTAVYDRKLLYDPEDIREQRDKNQQVPGRTVFWEEDREAVEKIIGRNPWAFNNYDLTDSKNPVKYIFKRPKNGMVTCFNGHEIKLPEGEDRVVCPECREKKIEKQVIYIDPDEE